MDFRSTIGLNEAQLAKPVHEKTDAGAPCAHHLSQSLLTQLRNYTVFPSLFSELCPEQRDSGAPQFVHDQSSQSLALNIVIVYVEQRFCRSW